MVAGSRVCWTLLGLISAALGAWAQPVRAQDQVTILDLMYTATSANTSDSHYRVMQKAGTPTNWRAPIDYASGKIHARVDVIAKPSNKKTLFNICFEGTPSYACMPYQPTPYTGTGVFEWEPSFMGFYQYSMVDWSKPISKIALILKDETEKKPQGSPDFYPTTLHVTLTLVRPGATFKPPATMPMDAGMPDAGKPDAGEPPEEPPASADSGTGSQPVPPVDPPVTMPPPQRPAPAGSAAGANSAGAGGMAGTPATGAAAQPAPPGASTPGAPQAPAAAPAATSGQPPATSSEATGGCAINTSRGPTLAGWLVLLALVGRALWLRMRLRSARRSSARTGRTAARTP